MTDVPKPERFVDAHVHLWDLQRLSYPWLTPPFDTIGVNGDVSPIARTYLLDDYLADAEGWNVTGLVHVDAGAEAKDALSESDWLQDMADSRGMPDAIIAFAALDDPDVEALLERHADHDNVRGIRHIANWHEDPAKTYTPRDVTRDPNWQAGFGLLAKYGLSFDFQLYPGQMDRAAKLAARHPDVPVIINHAGMPDAAGEAAFDRWAAGMSALAEVPSVSAKISGFGILDRAWTIESIRAYVLTLIDLFGTDRIMFASDFPTDKLAGSFDRHLSAYSAITANFSADERDRLFAANAERTYRIA